MKKQILFLSLFIASAVVSVAQVSPSFGIKAGVISAGMRGEAVDNLKNILEFTDGKIKTYNRTGFFAGGYASIPLDKTISIEPGIYFAQKGYDIKGELSVKGAEFLNANAKAQLQSNYIDIPLLLKADINGLQLFAGPQFSYLINADLKTSAGVLGYNVFNNSLDATDQFNRWDMGVTGGIGFQLSNGINLSASYDHGLSKSDANKNISSYNHAFKIGIGIRF